MTRTQTEPMTLANMRENGVRSLAITCAAIHCHHEATMDVSGFADDVTVPSFGPRIVCTICGAIGADARPNWSERAPASLFGTNRLAPAAVLDTQLAAPILFQHTGATIRSMVAPTFTKWDQRWINKSALL
jgi:hypothetical protein